MRIAILTMVLGTPTPAMAFSQTLPKALWVWEPAVVTDATRQQLLFDFCTQKKVGVLFVSTDVVPPLAQFNRIAHTKGMSVHVLDGDPTYAYAVNHSAALARLQSALKFNRTAAQTDQIDGYHWDVEPAALPEFQAGGANAQKVLSQYLDFAAQCRDAVKATPAFDLGFDVPFWFDVEGGANVVLTWGRTTRPVTYHLIDILNVLTTGNIGVMDYRNFTAGLDGSIVHVQDEVHYALKSAAKVRIWIGQEVSDVQPPKITFWGLGEATLDKAIDELAQTFHAVPVVAGVAIESWQSYYDLVNTPHVRRKR